LSPGQVFGASCLLSKPARFLVSTEVQRNSSVIIWKRNTIRTLATRHTQLLENALEIANEYLTWYLATHLSLVSQTARQRLANVLVSLARGIGSRHSDGIHLHVTNEDLANTANITLFTASRLLNEWQRGGALNKSRGKVVLLSPERLFVA
jgi:CRP-like cAMP-binding protein